MVFLGGCYDILRDVSGCFLMGFYDVSWDVVGIYGVVCEFIWILGYFW